MLQQRNKNVRLIKTQINDSQQAEVKRKALEAQLKDKDQVMLDN